MRKSKIVLSEEERAALIENPPRNAWIERMRRGDKVYIYMRWREGGEQFSIRITEEEAKKINEKLRERGRKRRCELSFEEFIEKVRELAEEGNEDAKKLLKRIDKERATIRRVLKILQA